MSLPVCLPACLPAHVCELEVLSALLFIYYYKKTFIVIVKVFPWIFVILLCLFLIKFLPVCLNVNGHCIFSCSVASLQLGLGVLIIFVSEWMSGDWCLHVTVCVCV